MNLHAAPHWRRTAAGAAVLVCLGLLSLARAGDHNGDHTGDQAGGEVHTEKVAGTPHFYQGDPRGEFPGDGSNYCCPTAVSDSLIYLAAHGFPRLRASDAEDPADAQIALVKALASSRCMKTDPAIGTDNGQACAGIQKFVEEHGYVCRTLEYRGWRPMPKSMASVAAGELPSLHAIEQAVADPHGAAWVNVGWYVHGDEDGQWKRVGGHWVAVVGYGTDGRGRRDPSILLIDNPAVKRGEREAKDGDEKASPQEIEADVMETRRVDEGRLTGNYKGLPRDAAGLYRVSGRGVAMSKKFDAAFIDCAIVLVVGQR